MTSSQIVWICVIAFFIILNITRVGVEILYENDVGLKLIIGLFRKNINDNSLEKKPRKKEKTNKSVEANEPNQKKNNKSPKDLLKKIDLKLIEDLLDLLGSILSRFGRSLHFNPFCVNVIWGGSDPASIGMEYGYLNAIFWPLLTLIETKSFVNCKKINLDLNYDYKEPEFKIDVGISFRIGSLVLILLSSLFRGVSIFISWKLRTKTNENKG